MPLFDHKFIPLPEAGEIVDPSQEMVSVLPPMASRTISHLFATLARDQTTNPNVTTSTLRTRRFRPQNASFGVVESVVGNRSAFANKVLNVTSQNDLILSTNPNRGLNAFLGDVTVAIGGF